MEELISKLVPKRVLRSSCQKAPARELMLKSSTKSARRADAIGDLPKN